MAAGISPSMQKTSANSSWEHFHHINKDMFAKGLEDMIADLPDPPKEKTPFASALLTKV